MQKGGQLDGGVRKLVVCVAKIPKAACFFYIYIYTQVLYYCSLVSK